MKEPEFTQHPTEIFGYAFTDLSSEAQTARNNQFCPFLDGECKKPRKSEPAVKVGVSQQLLSSKIGNAEG